MNTTLKQAAEMAASGEVLTSFSGEGPERTFPGLLRALVPYDVEQPPQTLSPEEDGARVRAMDVLRSRIECHQVDGLFRKDWRNIENTMFEIAAINGFHSKDRNQGEEIALIHSEVSEVLEALRSGNPPSAKIPEFTEMEDELGDIIIRVMAFARREGADVVGAILAKASYNTSRPYKHGKKF